MVVATCRTYLISDLPTTVATVYGCCTHILSYVLFHCRVFLWAFCGTLIIHLTVRTSTCYATDILHAVILLTFSTYDR